MNHKEIARQKFVNGYNCAQAVACTYAQELGIKEEDMFRMMEGFGGGFAHMGHICGVISGFTIVESYRESKGMSQMPEGKLATYAHLQPLIQRFENTVGYLNCQDILANGDHTLVDGKKRCCHTCIETACQILDEVGMIG